jgi:hypothetical protein
MYIPVWLCLLLLVCVAYAITRRSAVPHWSDDPAWRHGLRQWRRAQRRTDWAAVRHAWRTDLWHTGDGPAVVCLIALAAVVIAVCR